MKDKLKSRKLWVAIIGSVLTAILTVLNQQVFDGKIPTEQILGVVGIIGVYLLGQSHVDAKEKESEFGKDK